MTEVILADDHAIMRQGLAQLISSEIGASITGEFDCGDSLLEAICDLQPDIAVVDISMPGPGIPTICREIEKRGVSCRLIVLTMHQNAEMARQLIGAGAAAYVVKANAFDELKQAIECVSRGETYVSPSLGKIGSVSTTTWLTNRETEIVRLISQGLPNKKIARLLEISAKTVETHRTNAMRKLDAQSGAELVKRAIETGQIPIS